VSTKTKVYIKVYKKYLKKSIYPYNIFVFKTYNISSHNCLTDTIEQKSNLINIIFNGLGVIVPHQVLKYDNVTTFNDLSS
jgi:hypothetical protein